MSPLAPLQGPTSGASPQITNTVYWGPTSGAPLPDPTSGIPLPSGGTPLSPASGTPLPAPTPGTPLPDPTFESPTATDLISIPSDSEDDLPLIHFTAEVGLFLYV